MAPSKKKPTRTIKPAPQRTEVARDVRLRVTSLALAQRIHSRLEGHVLCVVAKSDVSWHMYHESGSWVPKTQPSMLGLMGSFHDELVAESFRFDQRPKRQNTCFRDHRGNAGLSEWAEHRASRTRNPTGVCYRVPPFDGDPYIINCPNVAVDLHKGELSSMPHDPRYLCSKQTKAAYKPDARCPKFQAFLDRFLPDPAVQHLLQVMFGVLSSERS